ncbi:MAG TPA: DMT family transporter [Planctomycetota bacterium]|nr:DMT family transporter [Planctomycetota bacterium]
MTFRLGIALAVTMIFWSSAFPAITETVRYFKPGAMALLRFGVASAALLLYGAIARIRVPQRRDLGGIFVCGLCGVSIYHVLLNYGQLSVDPGTAAFLINLSPVFTALIARFVLGERLRPLGWVGILVSFCGVPLIAAAKDGQMEFNPHALFIVGSALSSAIYVVVQKRYLGRYTSLEFTTYIIVAGTLCVLFYAPQMVKDIQTAPPRATLLVVYLGLFPAALAYVTWTIVLAAMPASRAISFLYLVPPLAVVFGWVFLGELPHPLAWVGAALAIAGVIIVNRYGRVETARPVLVNEPNTPSGAKLAD